VAALLVAGLRAQAFNPSKPEDQEFAHLVQCPSGPREYEIMVAFDFVDGETWEISCPPTIGFLSRLFGQTEEAELSTLLNAIHSTINSDSRVKEMAWYPSYGDKRNGSANPCDVSR
jgi:hypothetical protein